ncbi:MAG: tetratricopeptide repeat protein [Myxococcales bacterium]|nr:tetratricopeptide repeat protein [Myxococcales bacterium]
MSRLVAGSLAALLVATSVARGQAPAPPAPDAKPDVKPDGLTDDQKRAQAKTLYEQGLSAYNLGNFDAAISSFSEAYAISQAPGLLFNIAQSHRLKKDYEKATYFYTTYLRLKPDAPNRADVEARLEEMQKLIDEQKKMERRPPEGTVTPDGNGGQGNQAKPLPTVGPIDKPSDPDAGRNAQTLMTAGLATGGAGVALVITGFVFGSLARSAEKDLNALSTNMGTWTQAQQDRYDAGKRNNTIAIISFIAGGAAVATGGALYVLGTMKKKHATVAINPTRGGSTVAVGWSF